MLKPVKREEAQHDKREAEVVKEYPVIRKEGRYAGETHAASRPGSRGNNGIDHSHAEKETGQRVVERPEPGKGIGRQGADHGGEDRPQRNRDPSRPIKQGRCHSGEVRTDPHKGGVGKGQLTGDGYRAKAGGDNYVDQGEDKDVHPIRIVRRQG